MRFRKKPVVIDAWRYPGGSDITASPDWLFKSENVAYVHEPIKGKEWLEIDTLEGTMAAVAGDWVIRGTAGELYPCKPDIFAAIYEPA